MAKDGRKDKKGRVEESVMQYYRRILQELEQEFEDEELKGFHLSPKLAHHASVF